MNAKPNRGPDKAPETVSELYPRKWLAAADLRRATADPG